MATKRLRDGHQLQPERGGAAMEGMHSLGACGDARPAHPGEERRAGQANPPAAARLFPGLASFRRGADVCSRSQAGAGRADLRRKRCVGTHAG